MRHFTLTIGIISILIAMSAYAGDCDKENETIVNDCTTITTESACITSTKHKSGNSHGHQCVWSKCSSPAKCIQGNDDYDCKW